MNEALRIMAERLRVWSQHDPDSPVTRYDLWMFIAELSEGLPSPDIAKVATPKREVSDAQ